MDQLTNHRLRGVLLLVGILLSVFLAAESFKTIREISRPDLNTPSISVMGEGRIFVRPDIGKITLGVTAREKTVEAAEQKANEISNRIFAALKEKGVEEKDIKTTNYSINPTYDYLEGTQRLRGYEVSENFEVKIRDLSKSGQIISAASAAGANQVSGLTFTTDDPTAVNAEARKKAIDDAKKKGEELAEKLDVKLGKIISFYESSGPVYPMYERAYGGGVMDATPIAMPEIAVGENEVVVTVTITYQLK